MHKIKLGLIGLGYIGKIHLQNCLKLESAELVAVSDVSKNALNKAKKLGVKKLYTGYEKLLNDKDVEAVIIALPTHLHHPCAIKAAENQKHILLEKPLARNPKEGKEILSATNKNNVKLMVGYPFRYAEPFQKLKNKIETGELGDIQIAHAVNISSGPFMHRTEEDIPKPVPEWWMNKELTGGGALIDLGSHMINLARWYFGEITSIKAHLGYRFNLDFEDHAICIANHTLGTKTIINVGWFSQQAALSIELYGTAAHTSAHHKPPSKAITAIQLILKRTPKYFKPHQTELEHFINCIKQDKQPLTTGEDALKDLIAIEQAYKNQNIL
ncbi:MAG: Gfo/Idh/MocA family oxidoreductase [Candidatus Bathyarchaeia archaeon]